MNRRPAWMYFCILAAFVILQSTVFRFINIKGISPDLVLIFLFFSAHFRGPMEGQLCGFMAGVIEDCLGLAPLGFNTLIKTIIGFVSGQTRGKAYYDPILLPLLGILIASLFKQFMTFLLSWIFLKTAGHFFGVSYWLELGLTIVATPILFNIFRLLGFFKETSRISL